MKILCWIFGHRFFPSSFADWKEKGAVFTCKRCKHMIQSEVSKGVVKPVKNTDLEKLHRGRWV